MTTTDDIDLQSTIEVLSRDSSNTRHYVYTSRISIHLSFDSESNKRNTSHEIYVTIQTIRLNFERAVCVITSITQQLSTVIQIYDRDIIM